MQLRIASPVLHVWPRAVQSAQTRKGPPHDVSDVPPTHAPAGVQQPAHERRSHGW